MSTGKPEAWGWNHTLSSRSRSSRSRSRCSRTAFMAPLEMFSHLNIDFLHFAANSGDKTSSSVKHIDISKGNALTPTIYPGRSSWCSQYFAHGLGDPYLGFETTSYLMFMSSEQFGPLSPPMQTNMFSDAPIALSSHMNESERLPHRMMPIFDSLGF
ncbi:uncharacterized protein CLUP02_07099 [Colletotrichum lupini]|uniref:Uncharacterized protein n=1 Tax=Colletotrichum lupini TaxID=145971 RepID=A0A9Q8SQJ5_9PEZI|nr:uncharacterized protein CLUP02_07099 [Colletotrichum lupini]UQC81613.1 hypothetical protein CLUP02_07099 [Colletotrichum lupini]